MTSARPSPFTSPAVETELPSKSPAAAPLNWKSRLPSRPEKTKALPASASPPGSAPLAPAMTSGLKELPEAVRDDLRRLDDTPKDERSEVEAYLAKKFAKTLEITSPQVKRHTRKWPGGSIPSKKICSKRSVSCVRSHTFEC